MIVWVDHRLALAIHARQLSEHGGSSGVRDDNLLQSALARPQQLHAYGEPQPDLADLAASLVYGLTRNHPFVDGNKRTAYVCCRVFIALNGAELLANAEARYLHILSLADGTLSVEGFAAWLRVHMRIELPPRIQESRASYGGQDP